MDQYATLTMLLSILLLHMQVNHQLLTQLTHRLIIIQHNHQHLSTQLKTHQLLAQLKYIHQLPTHHSP